MDRMEEAEICRTLAASPLFDADWYLAHNPDVAALGIDPILHYVRHGEQEMRDPGPKFNVFQHRRKLGAVPNLLHDFITRKPASGKKGVIPIVFACNEKYAPYLSVALASLACNLNSDWEYKVHIFYNQMNPETLETLQGQAENNLSIEHICIVRDVPEIPDNLPAWANEEPASCYKILIPEILDTYQKYLYLHCDVVVNNDLVTLYSHDITEYALGAVPENWQEPSFIKACNANSQHQIYTYFNSGVILINNSYFIKHNIYRRVMDLSSSRIEYANGYQDILNIICNGHVLRLHSTWNCMWRYLIEEGFKYSSKDLFTEYIECFTEPAMVHFNSELKPLKCDDGHFARYFWKYASHSPFYQRLLAECAYSLPKEYQAA